jgi:ankyrin repeat protein
MNELSAEEADEFVCLCVGGTLAEIEAAIKNGADVNAKDNEGRTALMWATVYNRDSDVVTLLLRHGADAEAKDKYGRRAIDYAHKNVHVKKGVIYWKLLEASK